MTTTKNIDIKGIQTEIELTVNHFEEKATVWLSTQDWRIKEEIKYIPCREEDEYDAYEEEIMTNLEEVVIEERAKNVAAKVAELTEFAMTHNLSQAGTKISIDYAHHSSDIVIQIWGEFWSKTDRVGKILKVFICPVIGKNEYDILDLEEEYDINNVINEVKRFVKK